MFMDAMPFNLEFELNDLRIITMEMRHCALQLRMTEAAQEMLGIQPPLDYAKNLIAIEDVLKRIRDGEEFECNETFPAATLGVLWGWQLMSEFDWKWCAVSQEWWETLAVCNPSETHAFLPIQYFRRLAGETGEIGGKDESPIDKWPRDYLDDIRQDRLPTVESGKLFCVY